MRIIIFVIYDWSRDFLTLYIPDDKFSTRNRSYITNVIIFQTKHLFIYVFI
jgi:hypothetical protein